MSDVFILEIKDAKRDKIFNFLKGRFSVIGGLMDMIFGVFSDTYVKASNKHNLTIFLKNSKCYDNLNVKSCLKPNGP